MASSPTPYGPLAPAHLAILEPYLPSQQPSFSTTQASPTANLPHLTLTYAQSLDGKLTLLHGHQTRISGPGTIAMTHYLRARHDAILVGVGTAEADDPGLNCRYHGVEKGEANGHGIGMEQPRPVVVDDRMQWSKWEEHGGAKVFKLAREGKGKFPWWVVSRFAAEMESGKVAIEAFKRLGGKVLITENERNWAETLGALRKEDIGSVMVEGGVGIINGLLGKENQKYVGSLIVTIDPSIYGRSKGEGGQEPVESALVDPMREVADVKPVVMTNVKWVQMGKDGVVLGKIDEREQEPGLV